MTSRGGGARGRRRPRVRGPGSASGRGSARGRGGGTGWYQVVPWGGRGLRSPPASAQSFSAAQCSCDSHRFPLNIGASRPLSPLCSSTQDDAAYEGVQHFLFPRSRVTIYQHQTSHPQKRPRHQPRCASSHPSLAPQRTSCPFFSPLPTPQSTLLLPKALPMLSVPPRAHAQPSAPHPHRSLG